MTACLIYLMGASGSGKDSLLQYARDALASDPAVVFAHRYITRPAAAGGENHVALSAQEFAARKAAGLFALDWCSHGLHYAIGVEIDQWLERDICVVVNGSRGYLPQARQRYAQLLPVSIEVAPEVLRARLTARGRENASAIEARLEQHQRLHAVPGDAVQINNDGPLPVAGQQLLTLICQQRRGKPCA
ncbi:phosphonate metabolism protein/1,5-bisphosphokinase (PRPP-forming) PhnN [Devosia sp.]|uniref:phosphonate metabolism protein/1,5-bisphosphokinase (PRPP-forming) PhnN n=1 Tax=Devosia sp. TaxID=1871048 RepID=UPI002736DD0A|nr:phosphonate metabolism protein/1,5-bisphosphokinase (PRPP-forming) PhnN [Devosia sp.]MDP2780138.1 phosphonate metabolism protein/1,5-bisphosphokinase (PRPP-forming) PhnN [Devosia sp.]